MTQGKDTAGRFDHLRGALREFPPLIWSFLYFFFLLTGYYVLRPVRDAMGASGDIEAVFPRALVDWAAALSEELLRRRRGDGTWANRFTAAKEDDPLIATSFAAAALGISRAMMEPGR